MPSTATLLVLSNLVLALGLVIAAFAYTKTLTRLHTVQKATKAKGEKELERGAQKAREIVEKAVVEATEIVNLAQIFSKDAKGDLDRALATSTTALVEKYESVLAIAGKQATGQVTSLGSEIKQIVLADLANFKKDLEQSVINYTSELKLASESAKHAADVEIATYKDHAIAEFTEKLEKKVETLARELLGKEISAAQHTDLVIKALEKAKKEGLFS